MLQSSASLLAALEPPYALMSLLCSMAYAFFYSCRQGCKENDDISDSDISAPCESFILCSSPPSFGGGKRLKKSSIDGRRQEGSSHSHTHTYD